MAQKDTRKITAELPAELLDRAMAYTGEGITKTLNRSLEEMARKAANEKMLQARGTLHFPDFDISQLREDRD